MLEVSVAVGAVVAAGETVAIITAMKMETAVTAPCAGTVTQVQSLSVGDTVDDGAGDRRHRARRRRTAPIAAARSSGDQTWAPLLAEVSALQRIAHARFARDSRDPGVVRQRSRGKLTCRERIALLLDEGTFREVGSLAGFASYDDDGAVADFTPANHVGGWGKIDGRASIVCADDFTSRGGHADGAIGAKSGHLDRLSIELRIPSVRLLDGSSGGGSVAAMVPQQQKSGESEAKESSGAIKAGRPRVTGGGGSFLPGHLGSAMYARAAVHRAGGEHAARQRRRHRRGEGGARPLLGDGARHRAIVRRRSAGGEPRDGLRHHEGRSRRLAHPLQKRFGRQPRRVRGGSGGDDEAVPVVPAVERVRSAAGVARRIRPIRPIAATTNCSR